MNFLNNLKIKLFCKSIGFDDFGNQYFQNSAGKRFVVYKGMVEASKIPAEWHGWMHYSTNVAPININTHRYHWQKPHLPNLTGTKNAYSPKDSSVKNTNAQYQAWQPNQQNHE